ncbi:MAG: shikimate kinase AroK [Kangiellaceae bacterium]|jgi:shikimate kinase|nr:shikimate kinase AroK [Kangiellaceae bacterium]|tara:strand:- start:42382 stop:42903 length:522 start_codon:yes stop_codon:yes gene_type:complete
MLGRKNIFLIGPMGAGKSTIGKQLAKQLRLDFVDSDKEIEKRTGADISWIFDVEGEAGFRKRETQMIDELTLRQGVVLATGGGAIISADNRRFLSARGTVVYLKATIDQQVERTWRDKSRPLLQTDDPKQTLIDLMDKRGPLYEEVADIVMETDEQGIRTVSSKIINQLENLA